MIDFLNSPTVILVWRLFLLGEFMAITYDGARNDITFCTMLFKMPAQRDLDSLKHMTRKFEDFYLPSLEKFIRTFRRVALWCDEQTAEFIKSRGLDTDIMMHVMDFSDLPHYTERDNWLKLLNNMRGKTGYLLHHKTPEQWIDYLTLIAAKPSVMDWAAKNDKFNSKYFMWIDAGSLHPMYAPFWNGWTGHIDAQPTRVRMTIAPTLGKTRPKFVPKFIYNLYRKTRAPIMDATSESLARQSLVDIAMINADYDVPAGSFMMPKKLVHDFYLEFERVRKIMLRHGLVSTEQAVFQAMMKFDTEHMFELSYIRGYDRLYASIAAKDADYLL